MKSIQLLRLSSFAGAMSALAFAAQPGQAQEWSQYLAFDDRFSVDFPTEPSVEETTYETEYGYTLPARIYTAEDDFGTYSVLAVPRCVTSVPRSRRPKAACSVAPRISLS